MTTGDMVDLADAIADPVAVMQRVGEREPEGALVVLTDLIKSNVIRLLLRSIKMCS